MLTIKFDFQIFSKILDFKYFQNILKIFVLTGKGGGGGGME